MNRVAARGVVLAAVLLGAAALGPARGGVVVPVALARSLAELSGKVVSVHDGDTITVLTPTLKRKESPKKDLTA